jgi:5-methyltetrahydropteroyltriglutamate--homocysteine methyltransferase
MPQIEPILPGIYARSEHLVEVTRDHDRDRVDDDKLHDAQQRDLENLVGVQAIEGYTHLSPGLLTWQDHFRPLTPVIDGLETDTLSRFIDTNTFYRRPDIEGEPALDEDALARFAETYLSEIRTGQALYTLPSPTAFVTAARDEDDEYPHADLATTIAENVYPALVDRAVGQGAGAIALADPWLSRYPDPSELAPALEALDSDADLLLQLAFQDASPPLEAGVADPVDAVIVDRLATAADALEAIPADTDVGLGLVDARSSLVERPDRVLGALDRAVDALDADRIYLAPNGSLQHVPETIARRKVRAIGETARRASAKLGGDAR